MLRDLALGDPPLDESNGKSVGAELESSLWELLSRRWLESSRSCDPPTLLTEPWRCLLEYALCGPLGAATLYLPVLLESAGAHLDL